MKYLKKILNPNSIGMGNRHFTLPKQVWNNTTKKNTNTRFVSFLFCELIYLQISKDLKRKYEIYFKCTWCHAQKMSHIFFQQRYNLNNSNIWLLACEWIHLHALQVGLLSLVAAWLTTSTYFCLIIFKARWWFHCKSEANAASDVPRQTHLAAQTPGEV